MNPRDHRQSRRDFLRAAAGAAGFALSPRVFQGRPGGRLEPETRGSAGVVTRALGRTGLSVPVIGVGCGLLGPELAEAALDAGLAYFDTAPEYSGGRSEAILGRAFRGRPRSSFVVSSKIGLPEDRLTGGLRPNIDAAGLQAYFQRSLESSLRRLQLDFLDILYLYGPTRPEIVSNPLVVDALAECRSRGLIKHAGVSFHQNEPAMIRACIAQPGYHVILTACNFRQPHRLEVRRAIGEAARAGLGVAAMKTMAGVYWDKARTRPINARASLKWILQDENVHTTVPGVSNLTQLAEDAGIMADLSLSAQELEDLEFGARNAMAGLYCDQCGECRRQCRAGLDIPTAMRAFMYAVGYERPGMARELFQGRDGAELRCRGCDTCAVTCRLGLDVAPRLREVVRFLEAAEGVPA
jgi:predicted aldo/keto reductase-like oxidoreductase